MSEATGTLIVRDRGYVNTYAWNGDPGDRAKAREAWDNFTMSGPYIAVAFDSTVTKVGERVESFETIEEIEAERGQVVVQVTRAIVGG